MTEAEWLGTTNPVQLLASGADGADGADPRRLRLFACGCCRVLEPYPEESARTRAVEVAERHADQRVGDDELRAALEAAEDAEPTSMNERPWNYVCAPYFRELYVANPSARSAAALIAEAGSKSPEDQGTVCAVLRDVFGNPFRPGTVSPSWRTDTAVALAQQMYESREFSAMPILADALQDAGCTSTETLDHCREPKVPHVRGCWVVDQVLGLGESQ
jgi:hypothetical protein